MLHKTNIKKKVHRLIPSRYPPISLFDWVGSKQELEEVAALEGLTNERLNGEYGNINLVAEEDWVSGEGATPLMAAFTHPGTFGTRFSDGSYGVYYAADSLEAAIQETKFHRERFLSASKEAPCLIQMREYTAKVTKPVIKLTKRSHRKLLHPDPKYYETSQAFARALKIKNEWGLSYPSVRQPKATCVAIFRPPTLSLPKQGSHLDYIWDGTQISEVRLAKRLL